MKLPNNLYSRLTLITSVTLVTGYGLVYAWTTLNPVDAGANKPLTAALMQGIVNNINELNTNLTTITGKVGTLTNGKWCTTDGTKIDCTSDAPIGGGTSLWNTGATNTINYTAGNVGIGTASPSKLLHLGTTTGTNAEMDIQSGTKPKWGIYHDETTEQLRFWNNVDRVAFSSGGNVGIWASNPGASLQISWTKIMQEGAITNAPGIWFGVALPSNSPRISLDNGWWAANIAGNQWNIDNLSTDGSLRFFTAGSVKAVIGSGGNVGIGTATPGTKLDVAWEVRWTNGTFTDTTSQSTTAWTLKLNGVGGSIVLDDAGQKRISWNDGGGNTNFRAGNYFQAWTGVVFTKGASDINGGAGAITMNSDGTDWVISLNVASIGVPGALLSWNNSFVVTPTTSYFSAGNVGIWTSNPGAKLQVMDTVTGLTTGAKFIPYHTPGVAAGLQIQAVDTDGTTFRSLALNPNGGNVGIGTTNPQAKLEVSWKLTVQDTLQLGSGIKIRQMVVQRGVLANPNGGPFYGYWPSFPKAVLNLSKCVGFATPINTANSGTPTLVSWAWMADTISSRFSCSNCTASTEFSFMVIEYE